MKNGLGNLAANGAGQRAAIVRNRLKRIQYRPALTGPQVQSPAGSQCDPAEWCTGEQVNARCPRASWLPFVASVACELPH
jgi:hypothetical protein